MDAFRNIPEMSERSAVGLVRGSVMRVEGSAGMEMRVEHGTLWVTVDGEGDVLLTRGATYRVQADRTAVCSSCGGPLAVISVTPANKRATKCFRNDMDPIHAANNLNAVTKGHAMNPEYTYEQLLDNPEILDQILRDARVERAEAVSGLVRRLFSAILRGRAAPAPMARPQHA